MAVLGSTTDWYAFTAGVTRGCATQTVRHAYDLCGDRSDTHTALREARVSPAQAGVICDGVDDLPGDRMLRRRAETTLLDDATRLDATDLASAARRILDVVDPDHADRKTDIDLEREDRAAHAQRFFSFREDGAGGVFVKGRGTAEDAAKLRAALLPLSAPEPPVDPETGEPGEPGERDPRDHGARTWDALIRLAQHALDTQAMPDDHGTQARVTVTIGFEDLVTATRGESWAATDDGTFLNPAVVGRLACDAEVVPVVLDSDGVPLDVGRAHRTVTPAIWRTMVVRDRHCAFPGC